MRQYVIDELRPEDYTRIKAYLDDTFGEDKMEGLYWVPLDEDYLSDVQGAHGGCKPFYFAIEIGPTALACELLVRTRNRIRCDCIGYATERQRNWLVDRVDAIFETLDIKT
jgi:hypothetical protein